MVFPHYWLDTWLRTMSALQEELDADEKAKGEQKETPALAPPPIHDDVEPLKQQLALVMKEKDALILERDALREELAAERTAHQETRSTGLHAEILRSEAVDAARQEVAALMNTIAVAEGDRDQANARAREATAERDQLRATLKQEQARYATAMAEAHRASEEAKQSANALAATRSEIQRLTSAVAAAATTGEHTEAQAYAAAQTALQKQAELEDEREKLKQLLNRVSAERDHIAETAETELAQLRQALETAQVEVQTARDDAQQAAATHSITLGAADERIEELQQGVHVLTHRLQEADAERESLKSRLSELLAQQEKAATTPKRRTTKRAQASAAEHGATETPPTPRKRRSRAKPKADAHVDSTDAATPTTPTPLPEEDPLADADDGAGLRLIFGKPDDWTEEIFLYYWEADPAMDTPAWPGVRMTLGKDGWYRARVEGARATNLIFSDSAGHQTGNLFRDCNGRLDADGTWHDQQS